MLRPPAFLAPVIFLLLSSIPRAASGWPFPYIIFKGFHYSLGSFPALFSGTSMKMSFRFSNNANYTSVDPVNQYDINKLFGFTDCNNIDAQQNSARFGWRWNNRVTPGEIEILGYVDYKYVHYWEPLGSTYPGEESVGEIRLENGSYSFYYKNQVKVMTRYCSASKMQGLRLYPYFGGDEAAPHLITVWLRRIWK